MRRLSIVSFVGVLTFFLLFTACKGPALKNSELERKIASVCHPEPSDAVEAARILASPGRYEDKRKSRILAIVQAYLLGAELLDEHDRMLDQQIPVAKIHASDTYLKLQALNHIRKSIQHSLEDIYLVKVRQELDRRPESDRNSIILAFTNELESEIAQAITSAPDTLYTRIALLDVSETFEDLKEYYLTCDETVFARNADRRLTERNAAIEQLQLGATVVPGAHRHFAPTRRETGSIHVEAMVNRLVREFKREIRIDDGRSPAALPVIRPGIGKEGNIYGRGFPAGAWALTYDDGPGETTARVLDHLKANAVPATFFMLTKQLKNPKYAALGRRMIQDGHAVASHSYNHLQITKLGAAGRKHEIVDAVSEFAQILGPKPLYFRLPYGAGTNVPSVRQVIADAGMIHVFWNVDTLDWQDKNPTSIFNRAVKEMKQLGQGVVLFHDIHTQSVVASEMLVKYIKDPANRLRGVTIPGVVDEINAAAPQ